VAPPPSPSPPPAAAADAPAPVGIPAAGPYTILAPTDDAFDQLLTQMGGGSKLPESALLARPELVSILQYHVLPGLYTSSELGCCWGDYICGVGWLCGVGWAVWW